MADLPISTGGGLGSQYNTQSPQSATQLNSTAPAGRVQQGTADSVIGSPSATIPLNTSPALRLTNNLSEVKATTQQPKPPASKHVNPVFFALPLTLAIIAVVMFWWASKADADNKYNK